MAGQQVVDIGSDAHQLLELAADDLRFEDSFNRMSRRLRGLTGSGKQIRIAIAVGAIVSRHLDEHSSRDDELVGRRDQRLFVRQLKQARFKLFDLHRLLTSLKYSFSTRNSITRLGAATRKRNVVTPF